MRTLVDVDTAHTGPHRSQHTLVVYNHLLPLLAYEVDFYGYQYSVALIRLLND